MSDAYFLLNDVNFSNANLRDAHFDYYDLTDSSLQGAKLDGATFQSTGLKNVDFNGATFNSTTIIGCDLSSARGLQHAKHSSSSIIDTQTLFLSRSIPADFLRGAGVPDSLITFLPSMRVGMQPIEFYSCFISHSHRDEEFCKRLHSRMQQEKLRVWYSPEDMPGGKKLHEEIDQAIRVHDKLLLVLSKESMNSKWVATEIRRARRRERQEGTRVLFPIRLVPFEEIRDWELFDADEGVDLAAEIREYLIPDFSHWKDHDAFEAAFARLLRDLKNEAK